MVKLTKSEEGKKIYNLTHLCYLKVTVETLRRKSGPGQCFRCQRFGHAANCCNLNYRCVSCGQDHPSFKCLNKDSEEDIPPMCANCKKAHPANYKGCEAYPKLTKNNRRRVNEARQFRSEKIRNGCSYAAAAKNDGKQEPSGNHS